MILISDTNSLNINIPKVQIKYIIQYLQVHEHYTHRSFRRKSCFLSVILTLLSDFSFSKFCFGQTFSFWCDKYIHPFIFQSFPFPRLWILGDRSKQNQPKQASGARLTSSVCGKQIPMCGETTKTKFSSFTFNHEVLKAIKPTRRNVNEDEKKPWWIVKEKTRRRRRRRRLYFKVHERRKYDKSKSGSVPHTHTEYKYRTDTKKRSMKALLTLENSSTTKTNLWTFDIFIIMLEGKLELSHLKNPDTYSEIHQSLKTLKMWTFLYNSWQRSNLWV